MDFTVTLAGETTLQTSGSATFQIEDNGVLVVEDDEGVTMYSPSAWISVFEGKAGKERTSKVIV